jgi:uncharacterized FAD-dependent dehydrogenase
MIKQVTIRTDQYFSRISEQQFCALAARKLRVPQKRIVSIHLKRRSVDARGSRLQVLHLFDVFVDQVPASPEYMPPWKHAGGDKQVVIIGSGPAGLFAALKLLEYGIKPIILERGDPVGPRRRRLAEISRDGRVDPESNYCFGQGGAGTFSDGKLYTRSKKRGDVSSVLKALVYHGASRDILTDAHPHVGTDKLSGVIERITETIQHLGGEVHFRTTCSSLLLDAHHAVSGVSCSDGRVFHAGAVIAATGHSAVDSYDLLASSGCHLEPKPFAVGLRVEHPRKLIDTIQYHGDDPGDLGAASYRLKTQVHDRGVYSFCMCPGGVVVPSSSAEDRIVVNGMSSSFRNSPWSNAAIVAEIRPEDLEIMFPDLGTDGYHLALAARDRLEELAWIHGNRQQAPAQRLVDFLSHRASPTALSTSYSPGVVPSRIDQWLPPLIGEALHQGCVNFDSMMRGFIDERAILIAIETRTSSPVRVLRDPVSLESAGVPGLYPAGEGSGYAGGILSSAIDGERVASAAAKRYVPGTISTM